MRRLDLSRSHTLHAKLVLDPVGGALIRLQAKVRLIEAIRDALGEAEAYVDGKSAVECLRDALRKEAEHLTQTSGERRRVPEVAGF